MDILAVLEFSARGLQYALIIAIVIVTAIVVSLAKDELSYNKNKERRSHIMEDELVGYYDNFLQEFRSAPLSLCSQSPFGEGNGNSTPVRTGRPRYRARHSAV